MNLVLRYRRRRGAAVVLGTAKPGRTQLRGVVDTAIAPVVELQVVQVALTTEGMSCLSEAIDTMADGANETRAAGVRLATAGEG